MDAAPDIIGKYVGTASRPVLFELFLPVSLTLSDGRALTIPAGYVTNFASVPRFLWAVIPPLGKSVCIASLVHDWLYDNRDRSQVNWKEKQFADKEFYRLLQLYNPKGEIANKMMYVAVKLFGRGKFKDE